MVALEEKERCRIEAEDQLLNQKLGFSAAFLTVQYLFTHIKQVPSSITRQTIDALLCLIQPSRLDARKQSFFLFKEAGTALIHIALNTTHPLADVCISKLQESLLTSSGRKRRAISEALGSLPLNIAGPDTDRWPTSAPVKISFESLLHYCGDPEKSTLCWHGRTLRFTLNRGRIGCIKFATSQKNADELLQEVHWLNFLRDNPPCNRSRFDLPCPVRIHNRFLFKLTHLPDYILTHAQVSTDYPAIVFFTDNAYFHYPNEPGLFDGQNESVQEVFGRNAWLLGKLTSNGIIHTALIPLFHNRVQQARRQDQGLYHWEQGGRLDKWLESSRFPNFAASGLRDFEHLISIKATKRLHHFIGEHLLGLTLVAGSFFRNKQPDKKGLDQNGDPIDTRNLFDPSLFIDLLKNMVARYYQALTGRPLKQTGHFLTQRLIHTLIEQMGIDRHMEETLRIQDQNSMSDAEFDDFLSSRGCTGINTGHFIRGQQDIVLNTGPHLGGFNQPISVPELIDFLFCLSSLCISDRYLVENGLKAS